MRHVLVTGSAGFIGKNILVALQAQSELVVTGYDVQDTAETLDAALASADIILHLAGINRPQHPEEFETGNADLTQAICTKLRALGRAPKIILSSSIQAALDNPYGVSKRHAEEALTVYAEVTGAEVVIYRLPNVFGKWCRPNYNSVVATFCYHIARDLPITISDPERELTLVYIDDVVAAFRRELTPSSSGGCRYAEVPVTFHITLGELAARLQEFRDARTRLTVPAFSDPFIKRLYATYLSYLDENDFAYALEKRCDQRGCLAEFLKSPHCGQLFVSRTKPGITRGNHYHHTKTEKFLVVEGDAIIRFRHILHDDVLEYTVSGTDFRVVDIPTGYTHMIENIGNTELVVLFWASEIFDPEAPDTYTTEVTHA